MSKEAKEDPLAPVADTARKGMFYILGFAVLLLLVYFLWFGGALSQPLSEKTGTWGAFGDFFGGIMNPVVALFATYWLINSIRLQQGELADTRQALQEATINQASMAKTSKTTAILESLSSRLSSINIELQSAKQIKLFYLEQLVATGDGAILRDADSFSMIMHGKLGRAKEIINEGGGKESADKSILDIEGEIERLEFDREVVIELIKSYGKELSLTYL